MSVAGVVELVEEAVFVVSESDDPVGGLVVFHISSMAGLASKVKRFQGTVTKLHSRPWPSTSSLYRCSVSIASSSVLHFFICLLFTFTI